jgi:hypothetical protein
MQTVQQSGVQFQHLSDSAESKGRQMKHRYGTNRIEKHKNPVVRIRDVIPDLDFFSRIWIFSSWNLNPQH